MQNNSSENPGGPNKAVKYALMAFVAVSIGTAAYKITGAPRNSGGKASITVAQTETDQPEPATPSAPQAVKAATPSTKSRGAEKTAVVYYFYTNTRCSSCKTIEEYTREAVGKPLSSGYKGWKIVFKGVNIEEEPDKHFVQDYWLNTKSVVVQKFSGDKPLKWGKLEKVWQLLGDKEAFINYVTEETHKLLDER
ncbi:MAG TPA: hypothetical protein DCL44_05850 [Elusimicrobia bacterium]|nr:hypothetical protein [Elusimicrobiota bacterium]